MCHYRSYASEDRAKAEADRRNELAAKREQVVDTILREANEPARPSVEAAPVKETAPAK